MDVLVAAFEFVELLEDGDRERDVVFFKIEDATAVVEDDVGIENEELRKSRSDHRVLQELIEAFIAVAADAGRLLPRWETPSVAFRCPGSRVVRAALALGSVLLD